MSPYLAFGLGVAATYGLSIIAVAVIVISPLRRIAINRPQQQIKITIDFHVE
jgi:hypothetical protein